MGRGQSSRHGDAVNAGRGEDHAAGDSQPAEGSRVARLVDAGTEGLVLGAETLHLRAGDADLEVQLRLTSATTNEENGDSGQGREQEDRPDKVAPAGGVRLRTEGR